MAISIIWITQLGLDTQIILNIGNQWCVALLAFYASSFVPWKMAQELDAVEYWKVYSTGNPGAYSSCHKSSVGVRIWREGKNQNHHLPHALI